MPWASVKRMLKIIAGFALLQAPLMQRWSALETSRGDPYPLYAASNMGSVAGLISYPRSHAL